VALAKRVVASGLRFRGLMGYEGHLQLLPVGPEKEQSVRQALEGLVSSKNLIERLGIPVEIVSCGGTGDYRISGCFPGVTENQAGSFLLMDTGYAPFAPDFQPALSVLVTVVSKTEGERIVVDAGVKAISGERGLPSVKQIEGLQLKALHAEHAPSSFWIQEYRSRSATRLNLPFVIMTAPCTFTSECMGSAKVSSKKSSPLNSESPCRPAVPARH